MRDENQNRHFVVYTVYFKIVFSRIVQRSLKYGGQWTSLPSTTSEGTKTPKGLIERCLFWNYRKRSRVTLRDTIEAVYLTDATN
jgi:hypothetical protein